MKLQSKTRNGNVEQSKQETNSQPKKTKRSKSEDVEFVIDRIEPLDSESFELIARFIAAHIHQQTRNQAAQSTQEL